MITKERWTREAARELLERDDEAVRRAIVALYARQTADEQAIEETFHKNGVGFSAADAELMSSFARQLKDRGYLTEGQMEWARKKIMKYSGQLAGIANEKGQT